MGTLIHTLSYARAVSRNLNYTELRIPLYRGSSLTRKKYDKRSTENTIEECTEEIEKVQQLESETLFGDSDKEAAAEPQPQAREAKLHRLSQRSKTKIREKIFALYGSAKGANFTFLTLTFISQTDDTTGARCLNKFLTVLRRQYGRFLYLWVAERQKNGNIHFHFITNKRFPIKRINALWVLQQYNSGITNSKYTYAQIQALYTSGKMQTAFNPVDVRPIQNIEALSGYLTGYITKNDGEFSCSAWHCCRGVSALFTAQIVPQAVIDEVCDKQKNSRDYTNKKGEFKRIEPKTYAVPNKETGEIMAVVTNIVNKKYFRKHLYQLEALNQLVLSDYIRKKDVEQTIILDPQLYAISYCKYNLN